MDAELMYCNCEMKWTDAQ